MGNFTIIDLVDIVLVAFIMYQLYRLVRNTSSAAIFSGLLALLVLGVFVTRVLQMRLLGTILNEFAKVGLIILVILFQDEIRRFLITLGSHNLIKSIMNMFSNRKKGQALDGVAMPVVLACMNMAKSHTGALIVIEGDVRLGNYEETGEILNAEVSTRLIENVFFKNSPLHDGAMIIGHNKIRAAGCILPIARNIDLPKFLGLRHRAAIGITQKTDAKVIVVSEERGKISFVSRGEIQLNVTPEKLKELLYMDVEEDQKVESKAIDQ